MKYLTVAICLSIAVIFGCGGVSDSADLRELRLLIYKAEQGDATSQFELGYMYSNGQGVLQDYKTAFKWFTLAAEQKNSDAQYGLGRMYDTGRGVPQDDVYAHMWFNLAASSGVEIAQKERDKLSEQMTPTQIEEAQKLARECVRKEYKGC